MINIRPFSILDIMRLEDWGGHRLRNGAIKKTRP